MTSDVAAVVEALLALAPDERAAVAHQALLSLDAGSDQAEVDDAWRAEISRRLDDVLDGRVSLVDADEHYARLRAKLAARPA